MDDYRQKFCEVMVAQAKQLSQTPIQTEVLAVSPAIPHITEVAKGLSQWVSEKDAIGPFVGLARFYESQNAYQEVESWHKRGLKAMRQRFGEEHPDVATSLNNLAALYYAMGKYKEAVPYFQQSLAMRQKLLGEEHLDIAQSLNNLALLYQSMGRYEAAAPYFQQSLAMRQKLLGEEHPNVATSLNNLVYLYNAIGRYEEAIAYYQAAIALAQKVLGDNHPNTQTFMDNFIQLLKKAPKAEVLRVLPEAMHPAIRELRQQDELAMDLESGFL